MELRELVARRTERAACVKREPLPLSLFSIATLVMIVFITFYDRAESSIATSFLFRSCTVDYRAIQKVQSSHRIEYVTKFLVHLTVLYVLEEPKTP